MPRTVRWRLLVAAPVVLIVVFAAATAPAVPPVPAGVPPVGTDPVPQAAPEPFDLTYLPRPASEYQAIIALRPAALCAHPAFRPSAALAWTLWSAVSAGISDRQHVLSRFSFGSRILALVIARPHSGAERLSYSHGARNPATLLRFARVVLDLGFGIFAITRCGALAILFRVLLRNLMQQFKNLNFLLRRLVQVKIDIRRYPDRKRFGQFGPHHARRMAKCIEGSTLMTG